MRNFPLKQLLVRKMSALNNLLLFPSWVRTSFMDTLLAILKQFHITDLKGKKAYILLPDTK